MSNSKKRKTKFSWLDTSELDKEAWVETCPPGNFAVIEPETLQKLMPNLSPVLLSKTDSVLLVASGSSSGISYYMANIQRVDQKSYAIDQEPFGIAFIGDDPAPSGCFIHHGDWFERTSHPPAEFWNQILASGIGSSYPLPSLPSTKSGKLADLKIQSHEEAFEAIVTKMKVDTE